MRVSDSAFDVVVGPGNTLTTVGSAWPQRQDREDTVVARLLG